MDDASQVVQDFVTEFANGNFAVVQLCFDLLELPGLSPHDGLTLLGILKKLNLKPEDLVVGFAREDPLTLIVKLAILVQYPEEAAIVLPAYQTFGWTAHRIMANWTATYGDKPLNTWGVTMPDFDPFC
jgi:hypothetical protein